MALVGITKRVEIPHEPGEWMEIKKLSWKQLEKAQELATDALMAKMKNMGGDMVKALRDSTTEQTADPSKSYDREIVLRLGIAKWSYEARLEPDTIAELDEETASWAFKEILDLNKPRTEEEAKNA